MHISSISNYLYVVVRIEILTAHWTIKPYQSYGDHKTVMCIYDYNTNVEYLRVNLHLKAAFVSSKNYLSCSLFKTISDI